MKSHFLAANTSVGIKFPEDKLIDIAVDVSKTSLERERFVSAKISQKRKTQEKQVAAPEEVIPMKQATR